MSFFYVFTGITHFIFFDFYMSIMPDYVPLHKEFVAISGFIIILLGLLVLSKDYRQIACYSIMLLLILIFPANIYHFNSHITTSLLDEMMVFVRLPFQFILIYWAYIESKIRFL